MKDITGDIAAAIIEEEGIKNVFRIMQSELGYRYVGFEREKTGTFTKRNCGMRFEKLASTGKVEVVVGFYRPYYGVRTFKWRSSSLDIWSNMNSRILENATADERADGRTEYITNGFPSDYITYVSTSSHFSYIESAKDQFTDETQDVKRLI